MNYLIISFTFIFIKIVVVTERGLADLYQLLEDDVSLPEDTVLTIFHKILLLQTF